ncbi:lipocalin-like domain-containing protein [Aquimarina mytili]|uniref:Lipocalin family protein n=1 Tax=Aquimarina mytili TaxID=874423 RepID=A0A937D5Y8_9FLAO|nr:lipocalin family protein [Aquimarina mytili]MBL0683814.1 lipocalin family protein [Aquimarina mytili]
MKKLSLLTLLIISVFISCSEDDAPAPSPTVFEESDLVGKWQLTGIEENGVALVLSECEKKDLSNFSISENGENVASFVENIEDNETCTEFISNIYNWTLTTGNVLTTTFGSADTDTQTIIELTDTTLKLQSQDIEIVDGLPVTIIDVEAYRYVGEPEIPEDNTVINEADLIGKWKITSITENETEFSDACDQLNTIDFKENGQADFVVYTKTTAGECTQDRSSTISWSLSGNTIVYGTGEETETITELTDTTLKIQYTEVDGNDQFIIVTTYTKQ